LPVYIIPDKKPVYIIPDEKTGVYKILDENDSG
jgi:hypothetical protein